MLPAPSVITVSFGLTAFKRNSIVSSACAIYPTLE
jgi:hypothetical protein